jgi:hypothetical protein
MYLSTILYSKNYWRDTSLIFNLGINTTRVKNYCNLIWTRFTSNYYLILLSRQKSKLLSRYPRELKWWPNMNNFSWLLVCEFEGLRVMGAHYGTVVHWLSCCCSVAVFFFNLLFKNRIFSLIPLIETPMLNCSLTA